MAEQLNSSSMMANSLNSGSPSDKSTVADPLMPDVVKRIEDEFGNRSYRENGVYYINTAGIIQMVREATGLLVLLDTDSTNKLDLQAIIEFSSYFLKTIDAAYTAKYIAEREYERKLKDAKELLAEYNPRRTTAFLAMT